MLLKDYVASLERLLSSTPFVTGTSLSYEERPPIAGLVKATITFSDGSQLDLREFLILEPGVQTLLSLPLRTGSASAQRCLLGG